MAVEHSRDETPLPGGFRRIGDRAERTAWLPHSLRRRLRAAAGSRRRELLVLIATLEQPIVPIGALQDRAIGDVVRVSGRAAALGADPLWRIHPLLAEHGPMLVEEGFDFLIDDGTGDPALVAAAGGRLIVGARVSSGDLVTVVASLDRIVDPRVASQTPRRPPMRAVLRSGSALPLLIRAVPAAP